MRVSGAVAMTITSIGYLMAALPQLGQEPAKPGRTLARSLDCAGCQAIVDTIATLRFSAGATPAQRLPSSVTTNSRGDLFIVFQGDTNGVFVFNRRGQEIHRVKPASTASASWSVVVDRFDSLVVIDNERTSYALYSPQLKLVRQGLFGATWIREVERVASGEFAVSADVQTPRSIGMPLHRVSTTGSLISSFGAPDTLFIDRGVAEFAHSLSRARNGGFWTVSRSNVRIRKWGPSFELSDEIVFGNEKPRSFSIKSTRDDLAFVRPQVIALQEDPCGRLVLLTHVPAAGTQDPGIEMTDLGGRRMARVRFPDRTFQTAIEIVDPQNLHYVASVLVPVNLFTILPDGRALSVATDARGDWHTALVAVRVAPVPVSNKVLARGCVF